MRQPFALRSTLRSLLRTSRRSSRIWLIAPLLFVTACGGSTLADSPWGSTGFPDKLLPPPPWYIEWATEQSKLQPDPKQTAVVRAAKLIWEARSAGDSVDELIADCDEATLAQAGQMIMDAIGYDELMRRAEEKGWVEWVPVEQAQSAVNKRFIGQELSTPIAKPPPILKPPPLAKPPRPPNVSAVAQVALRRVMTKAAPAALLASQADSPAPGPGDALAVGILAVGLLAVGGIVVYEFVTAPADEPTTAAPAPASAAQPNATAAPPTAAPRKYPNQTCEEAERIRLEAAKKAVCPQYPQTFPGESCSQKTVKEQARAREYPCSLILARIAAVKVCVAARQKVQDECFKGSPEKGHPQQIDDLTKSITSCEVLKAVNCAPGHPMSGL